MIHVYYYDPTYILVIIGLIISLFASLRVNITFKKYSKKQNTYRMTGAEAASRILHAAGINNITIKKISGSLTDNYNPMDKTLSLSDGVYDSTSVAAIGVAAHECGHAIQDTYGYLPLKISHMLVVPANICSSLSWILVLLGLLFSSFSNLINIGIILFTVVVLFHLITLPVEINASTRAIKNLNVLGITNGEESRCVKKVLKAAAFTYLASIVVALLQLIRLIKISNR